MKITISIIAVASLVTVLAYACTGADPKGHTGHDHAHGEGHGHEVAENHTSAKKKNKYENEYGHALDRNGNFITGCPSHKEMIGVEGDQCPKCGYMTMLPITWSLEGIDTIRVSSLPDYHPKEVKPTN